MVNTKPASSRFHSALLLVLSLVACSTHAPARRQSGLNVEAYRHSLLDYVQGAQQNTAHLVETPLAARECAGLLARLGNAMPGFGFVRCDAYAAATITYAVALQPRSKLEQILHSDARVMYQSVQQRAFHALVATICAEDPHADSYVALQFFTYSADSIAQRLTNYSPGRPDVRACSATR
jgi:hypothetical protein